DQIELCDLEEAEKSVEAYAQIASEFRQAQVDFLVPLHRAVIPRLQGRFEEADALLSSALEIAQRLSDPAIDLQLAIHKCCAAKILDDQTALKAAIIGFTRALPPDEAKLSWYVAMYAGFQGVAGDLDAAQKRFADLKDMVQILSLTEAAKNRSI